MYNNIFINLINRPSRGSSLNGTNHQCKQQEKIIYFQDAIRLFQEYESEIRMCKEELQETKNKMKQMDEDISLYDKVIYMEGALWMIEKIITDVNKAKQQSFNQLNQYQLDLDKLLLVSNNSTEEEVDINAILKLTKNLLNSQTHINQSLLEKFVSLKDSTQKQIDKSSRVQQKLKKQKKHEVSQQSKHNQENINNINSINKNVHSQYDDEYEREQHITSAAISPISNHNNKYYHNYNTESNTTTQRIAQNLIPNVYNTNSVYSSNHNQINSNNYLSEHNQNSQHNQKASHQESSSHRQNNHYSSNSTPVQQYYQSHSAYPNSRSKDILEDSFNQRPIHEKQ